jgi:hypothetical protein
MLGPKERHILARCILFGHSLDEGIGEPFGERWIPHTRRGQLEKAFDKFSDRMGRKPSDVLFLFKGLVETEPYVRLYETMHPHPPRSITTSLGG